jgi:hypothetical protein
MRLDKYMAQKRTRTIQPGLMIKLTNDGLLCCHSSYILLKYLSRGHLMISFRVNVFEAWAVAFFVIFSS